MGRKPKRKKEEIAEDYCFVCKDGGLLRVCDYKDCLKAYHPQCVERDSALLETKDRWFCGWHFCLICSKKPKFHCFSCPSAVCGRCLCDAEFAVVKVKRGFCSYCLELSMLVEEKKDIDSNGREGERALFELCLWKDFTQGKIDFNDPDTYEFLFKGYWEIIKEKEGLTSEHVHSAYNLLKKGKNYEGGDEIYKGEEDVSDFEDESQLMISDYDDLNDTEEHKPVCKRKKSKKKLCVMERKVKSNKREFIGWGSKPLLEFLASIGKETIQELSQYDVSTIITEYCKENNLFHPEKRKKVICDARLKSLLGRKSVNKNSIYNLLTAHFAENLEESEHAFGGSSEDDDENVLVACERRQRLSLDGKPEKKKVVPDVQRSCFASVVAKNIKLVYLKRSLVQELSKQLETFDKKVMGSFVRVKSDPNDYLQKNSHQLVQVTAIMKTSRNGEMNSEILLQVSNMPKDVPICKLSDDDFSEEECEDLLRRVKEGLLKRPTVVELEQKARSLHEDITKHWIVTELALLQNRIDQANERGWRRELSEYMDRLLLLRTPSEQSRLLLEVPTVIADIAELKSSFEDSPGKDKRQHNASPESALRRTPKTSSNSSKSNGISGCRNGGTDAAGDGDIVDENSGSASKKDEGREAFNKISTKKDTKALIFQGKSCDFGVVSIPEVKKHQSKASVSEELPPQSHIISLKVEDYDTLQSEKCRPLVDVNLNHSKLSLPELLPLQSFTFTTGAQSTVSLLKKQVEPGYDSASRMQNQPNVEYAKKQSASMVELIELSDDEEQGARVAVSKQTLEDLNCSIWYCASAHGETRGPLSMSMLKKWRDSSCYDLKFKVWKMGQNPEEAIFLTDAVNQFFSTM